MSDYFLLQAQNNYWSNRRLLDACMQLAADEYFAERAAFFGSIHATLVHITHVDQLYLWRLDYQITLDRELIDYVTSLSDTDLRKSISFALADGTSVNEICYRVLIHLSNHQIHHRGQVHNMLSQTSVRPAQLDEFYF